MTNHTENEDCDTCQDTSCSSKTQRAQESRGDFIDRQKLRARLCRIKHKIVVLSGKGGVGKSTVAVNLAVALQMAGNKVGLLDTDFHGPSIPTMLGLEHAQLTGTEQNIEPVEKYGLKVASIGFFLQGQDEAVIWRGPLKMGVIKQLLRDVAWGDLDYLIIDSPPGTGDEPLSVCQLIEDMNGAVVVTTPQKVSAVDVRRSITFCHQLNVPVLGVVENMSGFVCPKCGEITQILHSGGGAIIADEMGVPFLGSIPIDPLIADSGDSGQPFVAQFAASPNAALFQKIVEQIKMEESKLPHKELS